MILIAVGSSEESVSRLGKLSFEQLREVDPVRYGFKSMADFLLYEVISEQDLGYREFHNRVDRRVMATLSGKPWDYIRVYRQEGLADPQREKAITAEVDQVVEREFIAEIEQLTAYWREKGKL